MAKNTGTINDYNQRYASRKQNWSEGNTDRANDAQRFNTTNAQDIANRNTNQSNAAMFSERDRQDRLSQAQYDNEMDKARAYSGVASGAREDARAAGQAKSDMWGGVNQGVQTGLAYWNSQSKREDDEDEDDFLTRKY
jgi:hypothetical protein